LSDPDPSAILVESVSLSDGARIVCSDVSFRVPPGTIYALMGHGRGPAALLQCLRGRARPVAGRVRTLGHDPRSRWRLRSRRAFFPEVESLAAALDTGQTAELLLLENVRNTSTTGFAPLSAAVQRGKTVFLTTDDPAVAAQSHRIGILARGRLVADEPLPVLLDRFRRIRFLNQATEDRTAFGTELDDFDAVRVRVRGWGVEAIVSNFDERAFDRFRAIEGVEDARAEILTLAEVLEALRESSP
jgi:ABC-type multidrug transport system ATPase subunit